MRAWLMKFALWLLSKSAPDAVYLIVPRDALLLHAATLTAHQERYADRSGEAKRHQALAALMKAFPEATPRQIALAIEASLP